jgi:mono/diheme cytochrome c family protein
MPSRLALVLGLCAGALANVPWNPAKAADAEPGKRIAERWCASCHLVSPGQTRASAAVPSFEEIARRADVTEAGLSAFLANPHPRMPDMSLTRTEINNLIKYLQSLR